MIEGGRVGLRLLVCAAAFGVVPFPLFSQGGPPPQALHLEDARVKINGQEAEGRFSAVLAPFAFLYFCLPNHGLVLISNAPFPNAAQAGRFHGGRLELRVEGLTVEVSSATPILNADSHAWVKLDPTLKYVFPKVVFGFASREEGVYESLYKLRTSAR